MPTEAEVLSDIVVWSADLPVWQRDALRRLATQVSVQPGEIDTLVSICKGEAEGDPIVAAHVRDANRHQAQVDLRQIHSVTHVNALAPEQRLTLHRAGLTVIYGDNGSGKSGYARILKNACRARISGRQQEIIPDIYDPAPGTPGAIIEYAVGGQNHTCVWQLGQAADTALSAISLFDSRTANVHVDDTNDVAYTPFPLTLLGSLAQLCKLIKDKLVAEVGQIKAQTPEAIRNPGCSPQTPVGQLFFRLSANTDPNNVETLSTISAAELDRLTQLTGDLAGDPARSARQLTLLKQKIDGQVARLDQLFGVINGATVEWLRALSTANEVARQAASAASVALFRDEPLPQIGSDVWQALWTSARAFSEQEAYPGQPYPVTVPDSVCVLCQQDLTPVAADRLNRFESFVRDDSQQRAEVARAAYETALTDFRNANISLAEASGILASVRDELRQDALAQTLRRQLILALWRYREISRKLGQPDQITTILGDYSRQDVVDRANALLVHAEALLAEADSPARTALFAEKTALEDRQWLSGIKADVLAQIERLMAIAKLEVVQRDTVTNRITIKSTEVAQALVTDALRAQFAQEVASFDIADLAVELRQQSSVQGIPRFKVALTRRPGAAVGQVLSEGEHRCVALAAFMAELATTENKSSIVFDDPVSSLDHMHREAVAKRLVAEAAQRQVIVFTHDLAFLFELYQAVDNAQPRPNLAVSSVSRGADKAGFCSGDPPFKARKVVDITASLGRQLANERRHFDEGLEDEWRKTVKSVVGTLRDTWEIAVEEVVSHVIRRMSNKVSTDGLIKVTAITSEDCEAMRDGFERCSALLHSSSTALNRPLPRPEEIQAAIDTLSVWKNELQVRQAAIR